MLLHHPFRNGTLLKRLKTKEWQLWLLTSLVLISYAICIAIIAQPEKWQDIMKSAHRLTFFVLTSGLFVLTILLCFYLIYSIKTIQKFREEMVIMLKRLSHELNNDLTVAFGYITLILQSDLSPETKKDIIKIKSVAELMNSTLHSILIFGGTKKDLPKTPIKITSLIESILDKMSIENNHQSIKVIRNIPADCSIMADEHQIQEVFINLFKNATESMHNVEGKKELMISAEKLNNRCLIKVADTGTGIKPAVMKRLFEPFFTTKELGTGIGLGLNITRTIITEHGGKISAQNNIEGGATFIIELPLSNI